MYFYYAVQFFLWIITNFVFKKSICSATQHHINEVIVCGVSMISCCISISYS